MCATSWLGAKNRRRRRCHPRGDAPRVSLSGVTRVNRVRAAVALGVAGLVLGVSGTPTRATGPPEALVRVDQVGYELGRLPMHAYLMSTVDERGSRFVVRNAARRTVYSGRIPSHSRRWSTGSRTRFRVYTLDFVVRATGRYTVSVIGRPAVTSPRFEVATPKGLYEPLLGDTLFYYRSVRDGPDFVRGPLSPAPAHLNDRHAVTYDNPPIQSRRERASAHEGQAVDAVRDDDRCRRWALGRRRQHEVRRDRELRDGSDADRRARLPAPDGRVRSDSLVERPGGSHRDSSGRRSSE